MKSANLKIAGEPYYNLDAIISVGNRINSHRPTKFRIWSTSIIKEYMRRGYVFGVEKDASFHSSIGQIYQTREGSDLYPSSEEKAAMLLHLVEKTTPLWIFSGL